MGKTSMEIVMSDDLKARLHAIAPLVGKTVQEFAQDALYTFVEDHEDGLEAREVLARNEPTISQEEMEARLALDNPVYASSGKAAEAA